MSVHPTAVGQSMVTGRDAAAARCLRALKQWIYWRCTGATMEMCSRM